MGRPIIFVASDEQANAIDDLVERVGEKNKSAAIRRLLDISLQPRNMNEAYPRHSGQFQIERS